MIKKLTVKNYKSLRDVELELGKITVLIGPNNSGKSNILDCLTFLAESCQRPIRDAFFSRGEYKEIVFGGRGNEIGFTLDFLLEGQACQYGLSCGEEEVLQERLVVGGEAKLERSHSRTMIRKDDGSWEEASASGYESAVYAFGSNGQFASIKKFRDYLSSWRLYQFGGTAEMRAVTDARSDFDLQRDGRNLTQVLISLRNAHPEVFDQVEEVLRQGIPEIENLLTPLTPDGRTHLAVREQWFEGEFDCRHLADGTLKTLAYITAASLPWPGLLCFEEPENSIHLGLLHLLVDLFQKSEKQIVFSTHLPYIINFTPLGDIRVIERKQGETLVRQIDHIYILRDTLRAILS